MTRKNDAITLHINRRELATILAALRFYQDENLQGGRDIPDQFVKEIATDGGLFKPLGFQEVGNLCERLNTAADEHAQLHPAVKRIHDLLYLDARNGRELYDPDKSWDADTLSMIAEVVAEYVPRPKKGGEP